MVESTKAHPKGFPGAGVVPHPAFTAAAYTGAMHPPPRLALLALLFAMAPVAARGAGEPMLSVQFARAQAPGGGALLYREEHLLRSLDGRPLERLVLYRCPSGPAFARKRVDYSVSPSAPAFALEDARSGYREGLRRQAAGAELYFRPRAGLAEQHTALAVAPEVADAGFDEFVRAHWNALAAGESLPLRFAVPARLSAMEFRVRRAGEDVVAGQAALRFRLRLDGLLGFIAPHIDVAYDARSHRLLRFEGLSNLRDPKNEGQWQVRIDFPDAPRPAAPAQWSAALSEVLVARCESGQPADSPAARTPAGSR